MMKKGHLLVLLLMAFVSIQTAQAQRTLRWDDVSEEDEEFAYSDQAGLVITCDKSKNLTFVSNLDATVEVAAKDVEDGNNVYYIVLDADERFTGRQLTVKCSGYYDLTFVPSLHNGYTSRYHLYDPNDEIDATCFQQHREKGEKYFDNCNYLAAREEFVFAALCDEASEEQKTEALQHIADCDSIIVWRQKGNEAAELLDYAGAMEYFTQAQSINAQDRYVVNRYAECAAAQRERTLKYFNAAEKFMKNKEYEDAVFMYKKVEELHPSNIGAVITKRVAAEEALKERKNTEAVIGAEFGLGSNGLYGISYGNYRKRGGGYINFKLNNAVFELCNSDYKLERHPEVNLTFGWTVPVVPALNAYFQGAFLHLGPGLSLLGRYEPKKSKFTGIEEGSITQDVIDAQMEADGSDKSRDYLNLKMTAAITPELGVTVKVWRVALRYTFQYRFAINTEYDDLFKKTQSSIGIGWCF